MILSSIVAASLNNGIGKDNQLPWHLPADLKFFKTTTMGCPVVMGRKTFQSIGRTLPGRKNVVITRDKTFNADKAFDIEVVSGIEEAITSLQSEREVFIIGGGEIFRQSMDLIDTIYLTVVNTTLEADVFFPEIDKTKFELVWEEAHLADEKNKFDYTFQKYVRK
ncbi:MAG: dihydrofolate reductase region [Bacteroidetes bacterium]|jgi:dihydrofolate reductase|nr:dihydrofolate reductase region [Bacteroidota bacterium]